MKDRRLTELFTIIILAASIALIITGICLNEPFSVLMKAANICLECIGIG